MSSAPTDNPVIATASTEPETAKQRRVWKFRLTVEPMLDMAVADMPVGAEVLSIGMQGDELYVWAIVDPAADLAVRMFVVVGTGQGDVGSLPLGRFLGTIHGLLGWMVVHVWEAAL